MTVRLTAAERKQLRQWQKPQRANEGHAKVTVLLRLDAGRPLATVVQDVGLAEAAVYRWARAFAALGLAKYLVHQQPGYWGLLPSAQPTQVLLAEPRCGNAPSTRRLYAAAGRAPRQRPP